MSLDNPKGKPTMKVDITKVESVIRRGNALHVTFDSGSTFKEDFKEDKALADLFETKFLLGIEAKNVWEFFIK